MHNIKKYRLLYLAVISIILVALSIILSQHDITANDLDISYSEDVTLTESSNTDYGTLEILVFNTGKADAILITTENHTVMIDTAERAHGSMIVEYLVERGITQIDYMIITHFDKDHVGGAYQIISNLDVNEVVVPNYLRVTNHYLRFVEAMQNSGIKPTVLEKNDLLKFTLDNADFVIYPSSLEFHEYEENDSGIRDDFGDEGTINVNNYSLVTTVQHGNNNFSFTGDAMARRTREIFQTPEIMNTDFIFLKVPHHGRYNMRSMEFIHAITPKYAVITDSQSEPASVRLVSALEGAGAKVFFTRNGNVYFTSDGHVLIPNQ